MFSFLGPLLGAGLSFLGNSKAASQAEAQHAASLAWAQQQWGENKDLQREFWDKNYAMQKEFAQSGIRWRMEDAKAAGVHPLFALGGGGASASPTAYIPSTTDYPSNNSGEYLSRMGQDIGRALTATQTLNERFNDKANTLALERAELENTLLRSKIMKENAQVGPPMPGASLSPGPEHGLFEYTPIPADPQHPANPSVVAGPAMPATKYVRQGEALHAYPNKNLGVEDEFMAPGYTRWSLTDYFGALGNRHDSDKYGPPRSVWKKEFPDADGVKFDPLSWSWVPYKGGTVIRQGAPIGYSPIDWKEISRWHQGRKWQKGAYTGGSGFDYVAP